MDDKLLIERTKNSNWSKVEEIDKDEKETHWARFEPYLRDIYDINSICMSMWKISREYVKYARIHQKNWIYWYCLLQWI